MIREALVVLKVMLKVVMDVLSVLKGPSPTQKLAHATLVLLTTTILTQLKQNVQNVAAASRLYQLDQNQLISV